MPNLTTDRYIGGNTGTLIFGGNTVAYAQTIEIEMAPTVLTAANVVQSGGIVGHSVPQRDITVRCVLNQIDADTFRWMSGFWGNVEQTGSQTKINLDQSVARPQYGTLTVATTTIDGTSIRLWLKKAEAVPVAQTWSIGKEAYTAWTVEFRMCDPADGSQVPGSFAIGDAT